MNFAQPFAHIDVALAPSGAVVTLGFALGLARRSSAERSTAMQYGFLHSADLIQPNARGRSGAALGDGAVIALIGLMGVLAAILAMLVFGGMAPVDSLGVLLSD